jgi:hypothetical protein
MLLLISSVIFGCGEEEKTTEFSNLPPFSPIVDLLPSVPYTSDDLEAIIISNSIDPEGAEVSVAYIWYKNDEIQEDLDSATVSADLTERGDIWTVAVISNDGTLNSADTRRSVTIRNSIPMIDTATLMWVDNEGEQIPDSSEPMVDDDLSAHTDEHIKVSATTADIDVTDEITLTYEWEVNGTIIDNTEDTLLSEEFSRGQNWVLRITPNDGFTDGETTEILFGFYNAVPVVDSISVSPEEASVGTTLSCSATATDDDDDASALTFEYTWTITAPLEEDGDNQDTGATEELDVSEVVGETLDTTSLVSGSLITCSAVASDGMDDSDPLLSAEITLTGNTLPVIDSVEITPSEPIAGDALTCEAVATDYEGSTLSYSYSWEVNGSEATAESDGSLDTSDMEVDTVVTCIAIANDGTSDSLPSSDEVTIGEEASE